MAGYELTKNAKDNWTNWRKEMGLTQKDIANETGYSEPAVSNIARGKPVSKQIAQVVAKVFISKVRDVASFEDMFQIAHKPSLILPDFLGKPDWRVTEKTNPKVYYRFHKHPPDGSGPNLEIALDSSVHEGAGKWCLGPLPIGFLSSEIQIPQRASLLLNVPGDFATKLTCTIGERLTRCLDLTVEISSKTVQLAIVKD